MPDASAAAPRNLTLPPPYRQHWLATGDVAGAAMAQAPQHGAGTLVWRHSSARGQEGRLDFAVVLEPAMALGQARPAFLCGMRALFEALAAQCDPNRAIGVVWPGGVEFDGGRLGGARLILPEGASEDTDPGWMVLAVELIADRDHLETTGAFPESLSLKEAGVADPAALVESFAAHLMLAFDRWTHEGIGSVTGTMAQHLVGGGAIDESGALVRGPARITLAAGLREAPWRDVAGPRL